MDEVCVEREDNLIVMKCLKGGDVYSVLVDDSFFTGRYWDYFNLGPILVDNPESILVLGLGGGTIVKQFLGLFDAHIDAVEINPDVVKLAEEHFDIREGDRISIIVSDAMEYLNTVERKYDVIVVDLFNGDVIPEKFTEPNFMALAAGHLKEKAAVFVNTITTGNLLLTSNRMLENSQKTFPTVFTLDEEGNRMIVALNFKADSGYAARRLDSYNNPLFGELKQKIKSKIR